MPLFLLNPLDILTFFAVLVRFSVIFAVMPIFGTPSIPAPVKILLSLAMTFMLYPVLVSTGKVDPALAVQWGSSASGIVAMIAKETLFGLALGFCARVIFDSVTIAGDLIGTFMGFANASQFDPQQESNTQVISKFQVALATILFFSIDGHHLLVSAALDSYRVVALGTAKLGGEFSERLLELTLESIRMGLQMAAPMAMALLSVNIIYGIMAKAMPQLNILVLSFSVSALIGLFVLSLSEQQFIHVAGSIFGRMHENMRAVMGTLSGP